MATEGRERWASRTAFIMAAIGCAVGLGNLWRFPAVAFKNGGGAFFIPYFVALITAGIPLMIVEYAIGQRYQGGAPHALAAITKKFRWVGWFALLVATVICMYYVVIMAYAWHYCVGSFSLAWTRPVSFVEVKADEAGKLTAGEVPAETIKLYLLAPKAEAKARLEASQARRPEGKRLPVFTPEELEAEQGKESSRGLRYVSLDENVGHYFEEKCLGGYRWGPIAEQGPKARDEGPEAEAARQKIKELKAALAPYEGEVFKLSPNLVIGAAVTWVLIFLIIFRGVHNIGKVVMITVPLPVILLLIVLVRGVTLPGATAGILYYLTPNWEMLKDPQVWIAAYGQIFFSLSLGFGVLIAYASYMPKDSDVTGSAFITSFGNCATSFMAGLAVFSVLGYLAYVHSAEVAEVVKGGPGLVFRTYPVALAQMPMGTVAIAALSFIFFLCLISLGIDSAFSLVEGLIAGFLDHWPRVSKPLLTSVFCVIGFCGSLFICTKSGNIWLDILDNWCGNYGLALVGLLECIAVGYFFHFDELKDYINEHSEIKVHYWFDVCIKFLTPGILIYLLANQVFKDISQPYGGYDQVLRHAVTVAGWGMFAILLVLAFILGSNGRAIGWPVAGAAVFGAFMLYFHLTLPKKELAELIAPAIMGAVGAVLLFGGLIASILNSRRTRHKAGLSLERMPTPEREEESTTVEPTES